MSGPAVQIDLVRGAAADALLAKDAFAGEWSELLRQCPWATPFQSPPFARTWYGVYRERFEPLLVLSRAADGRLRGLLPLAASRDGRRLVVAGAWQAEYHAWVCPPELGDAFPAHAFAALRGQIPSSGLGFRYLPPGTPTAWLGRPELRGVHLLRPHRRPLLRFGDGAEVEASLRKGSNKTRLSRLKKLGGLEFRHVTDRAEWERHFDAIIACHDTRHMAVRGSAAFQEDACKRPFTLGLLDTPGLMHATVMMVGGQVAAAHLGAAHPGAAHPGAAGGGEVQLGLIAHNPWLAKHSPGKFLIYFLARMLKEQGYAQLDLTAGGDPYKERFANAWGEVHTLDLFPGRVARYSAVACGGAERVARKAIARLDITPARARSAVRAVRERGPLGTAAALALGARNWVAYRRQARVYRLDGASPAHVEASGPAADLGGARRDALEDLLAYRPAATAPSRQTFVAAALRRAEEGWHVYTRTDDGRLLCAAWLLERPGESADGEVLPGLSLPSGAKAVIDFDGLDALGTVRGSRGPDCEAWDLEALRAMLRDVGRLPRAGAVFAVAPAGDAGTQAVLERAGFVYDRLLARQTWLGRRRGSAVAAPPNAPPGTQPDACPGVPPVIDDACQT